MITKYVKRMREGLLFVGLLCGFFTFTSCEDILETDSSFVMYEKDHTLTDPTDSVYSVLGIINQMQKIADRTVLLGEVRADLVTVTDAATSDLKRLSAWDFSQENKYNNVSDYYSVINHCNYFLHHVDTTLQRRGYKIFEAEYAAVKAFRAWTYLELAKHYGRVPLVTEPLMTEIDAREAMNDQSKYVSMPEICEYFIADLTPYAYRRLPAWGSVGGFNTTQFFIPMRALLGDLCLWAERYNEAAYWYHDFLTYRDDPQILVQSEIYAEWSDDNIYQNMSYPSITRLVNPELSYIPMELREFEGVMSELNDIFNSTSNNYYYFQVTPSVGMRRLSAQQIYCMEYKTDTQTDTLYFVPKDDPLKVGDLRLYGNYDYTKSGSQNEYSQYNSETQSIRKYPSDSRDRVPTYTTSMLYLRYAEALNRAGFPQSAMTILKHGVCQDYFVQNVDSVERAEAGALIEFDPNVFLREDAKGIHSFGSGDSQCNEYYVLPMPADSLATRQDTIDYQIPLVEDLIITEMALDGAFEGFRLYDLMRVAMRRGDNAYLADPVSMRNGEQDAALRAKLMNQENWYLPLP